MAFRWESVAEEQIRQAYADGAFDALPGFGQPIPGIDEPLDELWWVKAKLKREELNALPPALAIRLDVHKTLQRLAGLRQEAQVRQELVDLNERIRQANFASIAGPPSSTMPLDIDEELNRWREAIAAARQAVD